MWIYCRLRLSLVLLALPLSAVGATSPKPKGTPSATAKPPNIILITLDTTRADRMGFLGSRLGLTPNLDALAKESVAFTRAYAQVPLTTPSHAVLLTGTYPQFNHLEDLTQPLSPELPYLPDLLHQHGYHTAAFVGAMVLDPKSKAATGFDRGFDVYDAEFHNPAPGENRYHSLERRAEDVANHAMAWLSHHPATPFFIWLHFYDPHEPYDPPEPFKHHFAHELYDGEIAYTDSVVGSALQILQRHGLYKNAVIAVAADHGEAFGEHGEKWHGMFLYDETIRVPLLLKLPNEKFAGKRVDTPVALADIAPSLLESAHVPVPKTMQGQSLFRSIELSIALISNQNVNIGNRLSNRAIYSETSYAHRAFGWSELRSWRADKYLYVQAPRKELYDQVADPDCLKNLASTSIAVVETLNAQLSKFREETSGEVVGRAEHDPASTESLRALGYLGSNSGKPFSNEQTLIDPKDEVDFATKLHQALFDLEADRYESAFTGLQKLTDQHPFLAGTAYLEFGRALVHREQYEDALPILRTAAEKMPESSMAHYELALELVKLERWEAALPELQAAVLHNPNSGHLHFDLASIYLHLNHVPEAFKEYERILEIDPDNFQANFTYGRLLLLDRYPDSALPRLARAAKVNPKSAQAHDLLGDAYQQLGQTNNASREYSEAASLRLRQPSD